MPASYCFFSLRHNPYFLLLPNSTPKIPQPATHKPLHLRAAAISGDSILNSGRKFRGHKFRRYHTHFQPIYAPQTPQVIEQSQRILSKAIIQNLNLRCLTSLLAGHKSTLLRRGFQSRIPNSGFSGPIRPFYFLQRFSRGSAREIT